LTDSRQNAVRWMTASTDGKRIAFLSSDFQSDVYVSDFNLQRLTLSTPKRLTLDDRLDYPTAWTHDSKSILFTSTRNGTYDLFRQDIDTGSLEVLVAGPHDQLEPRVTDDGRWVLYKERLADQQVRLMRVPVTGGAGQVVCPITKWTFPLCSASNTCIAFEIRPSAVSVFSLDVNRGKGPEIANLPPQTTALTLLPDGNQLAFVVPRAGQQNRIRLVSLSGEPQREVVVKQATRLVSIDASSSGLGFFSTNITAKGTELLFIRPDGTSRTVWSAPNGAEVGWGIPSPDGKHLAINVNVPQSNAWMMTDF
jgi:Tol biopolymer transport system component